MDGQEAVSVKPSRHLRSISAPGTGSAAAANPDAPDRYAFAGADESAQSPDLGLKPTPQSFSIARMPASAPIHVRDRATGKIFEEKVLGRKALDWAYGTAGGRLFLAAIGSRGWFSALYGAHLRRRSSRAKIGPFVRDFGINLEEAVEPEGGFSSFNDFFIRALKPGVRPLPADADRITLPADARHLVYPDVSATDSIIIKGSRFSLEELLGDPETARVFSGGSLVVSRLCPVDYHRFHFCTSGVASAPRLVKGPLYSVSPIALRRSLRYLVGNKRVVTLLASPRIGQVAQIEIGATMVGSIRQTYRYGTPVDRGQEKGWFEFGGSSTALVFERGAVAFDEDLVAASREHLETFARMGESLGSPSR
jgi:phosphatidylserine decarboxylase